jgi:imidazole glycerol-phosphate synthase subunit HisH
MGWNQVTQRHAHPLWKGIEDGSRFYFVHSYYVKAARDEDIFGTTQYGGIEAHVATGRDAVFAIQFHPEKSADAGLRLLENFVNWAP